LAVSGVLFFLARHSVKVVAVESPAHQPTAADGLGEAFEINALALGVVMRFLHVADAVHTALLAPPSRPPPGSNGLRRFLFMREIVGSPS
jgi:hypothetical protein